MSTTLEPGRIRRPRPFGRVLGGISAVGVKELRGRMRGRRAFIVLTIYLVLLAVFAGMVELTLERNFEQSFGGFTYASAEIGRGIFAALLMLETLLVVLLAPAFTAGAISLEREKQTLDLLAVTPISSLAIVLGKLLSALTYVFLLIAASVPLTALVFVFGGVAPDDVVRGYVVLLVTALGFGTVGLACSAIVRRTQAATIITYAVVLALTLGAVFVWFFWASMSASGLNGPTQPDQNGAVVPQTRAPEQLLWLNPFIAQIDVLCGTEATYGSSCAIIAEITGQTLFGGGITTDAGGGGVVAPQPAPAAGGGTGAGAAPGVTGPVNEGGKALPPDANPGAELEQVQPFGTLRDAFWPQFSIAWIVISLGLVTLSVQLVSPTRRWRVRRGGGRPASPPATPTAPPPTEPTTPGEPA